MPEEEKKGEVVVEKTMPVKSDVSSVPNITSKEVSDWLLKTNAGVDDKTKYLFLKTCEMFNLNPLKREIYLVGFGKAYNIIIGYEVYLKRAERHGDWGGFKVDFEKFGENDMKATCTVYRKSFVQPVSISVLLSEYKQNSNIWNTKPTTMLRKVAIAQAFRMAFPEDLAGLPYTSDELGVQYREHSDYVEGLEEDFKQNGTAHLPTFPQEIKTYETPKEEAGGKGAAAPKSPVASPVVEEEERIDINLTRFGELQEMVYKGHNINEESILRYYLLVLEHTPEKIKKSFADKISDYIDKNQVVEKTVVKTDETLDDLFKD